MGKRWTALVLGLALGAAAWAGDEGVTATEIRIGASAVLSGPLGSQTKEYGVGSQLYFDHVTERRMRARFAARFGARQADEGAGAMRADARVSRSRSASSASDTERFSDR